MLGWTIIVPYKVKMMPALCLGDSSHRNYHSDSIYIFITALCLNLFHRLGTSKQYWTDG